MYIKKKKKLANNFEYIFTRNDSNNIFSFCMNKQFSPVMVGSDKTKSGRL